MWHATSPPNLPGLCSRRYCFRVEGGDSQAKFGCVERILKLSGDKLLGSMKAFLTALVTSLTGAAVALLGAVVLAIPATLLWLVTFEAAADPSVFLGGVSGAWLLGHGVPLAIELSAETAVGFGADPVPLVYPLSLPLLGIAVMTAWGGAQIGWRSAAVLRHAAGGFVGAVLGFVVVTALITGFAQPILATSAAAAAFRPTVIFAVSLLVGVAARAIHSHRMWELVVERLEKRSWGRLCGVVTREVARVSAAVFALVYGTVSLGLAVLVVKDFTAVVGLSQSLQLDVVGTIVMAVVQLLLLPVMLLWAVSWTTGAGFALGAGTSISPFENLIGPAPMMPILGVIPEPLDGWSLLPPLTVVVCGIIVGAALGTREPIRSLKIWQVVALGAGAAVLLSVVQGLLNGFAIGSIGPARLTVTGPDPWPAAGLFALEAAAGVLAGLLVRRLDGYWIEPLETRVTERRTEAKLAREREWAKLGKPETFGVPDDFAAAESAQMPGAAAEEAAAVEPAAEAQTEAGAQITDAAGFFGARANRDGDTEEYDTEAYDTGVYESRELRTEWFQQLHGDGDGETGESGEIGESGDGDAQRGDDPRPEDSSDEVDADKLVQAYAWDAPGNIVTEKQQDKAAADSLSQRVKKWLRRKP